MSYQHLFNTGMDKQSHSCAVGSVQSVTNPQASFTTSNSSINKAMDKDRSYGGMGAGPVQGISSTMMTSRGSMMAGQSNPCNMTAKSPAVNATTGSSFYNQESNLQSYLKMNAHMNAGLGRAANYGTSMRMPGHYGPNYLLPQGTKRKQKDPNRPKRPTTAYFYFAQLEREEAAKRGERISKVSEWTKRVAEKWRNLSEEERTQFRAMAAEDKTRFDQEMAVYTGKDANKPKRPQSSYFLWLADFRIKMKDKISEHKEILRAAGEEWRKLTLEEKAPYEQMAEEERKKYEERMKEYQEMTKRARIDVSRPPEGASVSAQAGSLPSVSHTFQGQGRGRLSHVQEAHEVDDESSNDDDNDDDFSEDEE